ncbi:regulator of volume decrease after cellular swelling-domain-containing protein [Chaetomidium leptoderma]|uniref:Regulator of volume decrease after cellular swelling-domain-containing protein n=1 Tax=Chaetomidium leptoderma TaxID=669021 RepID=A0AAN6VJ26_9PEZI|nr:regulator of volume decrease after cellular swelling-domain-containing protein [Chaetomidium leptoderma]
MSLQTVRSPFAIGDYTLLSEHQEQTPDSFYDGKPVLHYHATGAKAWVPKSQRGKLPFFPADLSSEPTAPENSALSGQTEESVEQKVDIFVNSRYEPQPSRNNLSIFCPSAESGVLIPYQQISIHAIKTLRASAGDQTYPAVYLQLELASGGAGDDEFDTVELTLIPHPQSDSATGTTTSPKPEATQLFEAISECSNLNPDPVQDGDDEGVDEDGAQIMFEGDHEAIEGFSGVFAGARDGGLPPAMPGSGGWITADNVDEYFDAEGNWIGGGADEEEGEELGEGAGTVHARGGEQEETNGMLFLFLWLVLPYDNAVRLAFRWNAKKLKAALISPSSERWVYAPPEYPVDLGRDVVVIVKTGYGTKDRVPAWLDALGSLNEFQDIIIIADSEGHIGFADKSHDDGLHVHDAVGHSLRLHLGAYKDHPRVKKYHQLAEALYKGDEALALEHCRSFGWELDAMKFISGLEMTYQKYPGKEWYLLVDDDTFIIQPSLKPLLEHLDPKQPHYLGNAVGDFKARFAHGGSAVILSHAAMRALIENQSALASVYVASLDETWGDRLLAKALLTLGIHLDETYNHLFNGEPPLLSKIRADRICSPVISFHKLPTPEAMREVGHRFGNASKPVLWNDLWEIYGHTPPWRKTNAAVHQDWDHVGVLDESTHTIRNIKTAEQCKKDCDRRSRACLAWTWDSKLEVCHISNWMIVGEGAAGHVSDVNSLRARYLETNCILY